MLLEQSESCLFLVDVQEKLSPYVLRSESIVSRCHWLLSLARELNVPIIGSEQYPNGLGKTVNPLKSYLDAESCVEKIHFSSFQEPTFQTVCQNTNKQQFILAGIETHVCVLQSALDMHKAGFDVFVVVDAVSSRNEVDHECGLKRMQQNGIHLISAEMVFFEWLRQAGTPEFKRLSKAFLR